MTAANFDSLCGDFESAWKSGQRPSIEAVLKQVAESQRSELLIELLLIELCWRREESPSPTMQEYRDRYPQYGDAIASAFSEFETSTFERRKDATARNDDATLTSATLPPNSEQVPSYEQATLPPNSHGGSTAVPASGDRVRYFGEYELLDEIARGGMGVVYKARQIKLNRIVALKMILSGLLAGDEAVKRFQAEAEAAAKLDHPGIVPIYEIGEHDGQHYFSMGFVDGQSLQYRLRDGPLDPKEAADVCQKVCAAVSYAHEKGVVHRDLKPSNILLDSQGAPKVTDFGLAKQIESDNELTRTGAVLGTPNYMPPEQASGKIDQVGPLADVYSLGAILYCLLTGRPPFHAASVIDVLKQVIESEPVAPSALNPAIDTDLETICLQSLEKSPDKRYRSATALSADLRRYLKGEPVHARPIGQVAKTWRWCKRNSIVSTLAIMCVAILVGGAIVSTYFGLEARRSASLSRLNEEKAIKASAESKTNEIKAIAAQETAETTLAKSLYNLALTRWEDNRVEEANLLLDDVPPKYRGFEWRLARRRFLGSYMTCYGHMSRVTSACFDVNGTRIVSGSEDGTIRVWDAVTAELLVTLTGHSQIITDVCFDPDGRRIASASMDTTIKIWDAANGQEIDTLRGHGGAVTCVHFYPNGERVLSASWDKTIKVWDVQSAREISSIVDSVDNVNSISINSTGTRFAAACGRPTSLGLGAAANNVIRVWNAKSGEEINILRGHTDQVTDVSFSPDDSTIASSSADESIKVWDAVSGTVQTTLRGHEQDVTCVRLSPCGMRIVSGSDNGEIKLWNPSNGQELATLKGHTGLVSDLNFSPDGTRLASASHDNSIKVWDLTSAEETRSVEAHSGWVNSVVHSPDGSQFATCGHDNTIRIWDASSGREISSKHTGDVIPFSLCYSPNGMRIVSGGAPDTVTVWDATTGAELRRLNANCGFVRCVRFLPNADWIVWGGETGEIGLVKWNGSYRSTLNSHKNSVTSIDFSPDGTLMVSGSFDNTIKIWDAKTIWDFKTRQEPKTLTGHTMAVRAVKFSPGGSIIASGSDDGTIRIWDSATGLTLRILKGHSQSVTSVSFSVDGKRLVSAGGGWLLPGSSEPVRDKSIKIWDVSSGDELATLTGHTDSVESVSFSHVGSHIASAGRDGTVRIWDARPHDETTTLGAHDGYINNIDVSSDGNLVASASDDHTIKLWDIANLKEIRTLNGHTIPNGQSSPVLGLDISPDGTMIVSMGGTDIKLWDAITGDLHQTLKCPPYFETARVNFSSNGQRVYSRSDNDKMTWDVATGNPLPEAEWVDVDTVPFHLAGTRQMVVPSGNQILLVDVDFKNRPDEKVFRECMARQKPYWHLGQAKLAEQQSNWLAATFHWAWSLNANPDAAKAAERLKAAYEKWKSGHFRQEKEIDLCLPPVVREIVSKYSDLLPES